MGILLDSFNKFITEHGSAAIRADHIALLRDQLKAAEKEIENLKTENGRLKKELADCNGKLKAQSRRDEFVEHRSALFKRKPEGGYFSTVYCPNCHKVASTIDDCFPYSCNCGWAVNFTPSDLERILKELP